jgi:hypothetical protein
MSERGRSLRRLLVLGLAALLGLAVALILMGRLGEAQASKGPATGQTAK